MQLYHAIRKGTKKKEKWKGPERNRRVGESVKREGNRDTGTKKKSVIKTNRNEEELNS